ncbi:helix-turn-helix transcriptional regulator [Lactobacillus sp. ESL0677]|uniref:helix-turn-helix domain-containing protein n=1 Tax=Lactobacillus sp. ESL0677 TaxID=2983208 RepID=UPI0023FA1117|nr:helix-turn-helix transcriptional regulator [Lactobacillus sp. ESL0677]WEV36258.1 helix-turn-helix transcriptional regulator [Lactobacillus sp. ESL0677]
MNTFERIKELTKQQHLTLAKVNEQAGIGTNSIYRWKTQTPTSDNLQKVAQVLHTSTDYLLGNTDDPSPVSKKEQNPFVDIADDEKIYAYRGKPIPKEYLDVIRSLMDSDIKKGKDR